MDVKFVDASFFSHFPDKRLDLAFAFFLVALRKTPKASPISQKQKFRRRAIFKRILVLDHRAYGLFNSHAIPTSEANGNYNIVFLLKGINIVYKTEL